MKRFARFSIASLLVATSIVAVAVCFWPRPPMEPIIHRKTVGQSEITGMYYWFDDARGVINKTYDDKWESHGQRVGKGNVISIWHLVHAIGTLNGTCYNRLQIQIPSRVAVDDHFDINIVNSSRAKTYFEDDETCSEMDDGEATVFRFYNPSMDSLTDETHGALGSIKILDITRNFVEIELDLIDGATMRRYPNGIPKTIKLQRRTVSAR